MKIQWLGSPRRNTLGQTGCQAPPCPNGMIKSYDPSCISGTVRCAPGALDRCPASDVVFSSRAGRCVPITCPQGTARNERDECQVAGAVAPVDYCVVPPLPAAVPSQIADRFRVCWNGQCNSGELSILLGNLNSIAGQFTNTQPAVAAQILRARDALVAGGASLCPSTPPTGLPPPAAGECWDAQEIAGAQPCFYFNEAGNYIGPPELVQNVDLAALRSFCLQMYFAGYFDMPICDIAAVPAPPSCIKPEVRRTLRYCRDVGWQGDDRAANYFCWYALKAPAELAEWEGTPDCPTGQVPIDEDQPPAEETPVTPGVCNPGFAFDAATNLCVEISKPAPTAKSSAAVPLLIGAAVVGAAVYFLS